MLKKKILTCITKRELKNVIALLPFMVFYYLHSTPLGHISFTAQFSGTTTILLSSGFPILPQSFPFLPWPELPSSYSVTIFQMALEKERMREQTTCHKSVSMLPKALLEDAQILQRRVQNKNQHRMEQNRAAFCLIKHFIKLLIRIKSCRFADMSKMV